MIDEIIKVGTTSKIIEVWLADSSSTTGAGLTGLAYNTASLSAYYSREDQGNVGASAITLATMTKGTWATGGFVEKDATNEPGVYQFSIPDAVIASGAKWAKIQFKGATNLAPKVVHICLTAIDLYDTVRAGMTALPPAAAEAAGGLYTRGTGAGQIKQTNNGEIDANATRVAGTAQTAADIGSLVAKFAGITLLKHWLGAIMGKQNADATALTEIRASGAGSGTYDPNTDALEALKDLLPAATRAEIDSNSTQLAATITALGIIDDFVDDLEGRLTNARAGYLDNLSAGAVAQAATALSTAQWTNARAALIDQLSAFAAGKYNSIAFGDAVKAIYATAALKSSGAGTTNPKVLGADGTTIIDATADANGNITASTVTP